MSDKCKLLVIFHLFPHNWRVTSIDINWMHEPAQEKLHVGVGGFHMCWVIRIFWLCPLSVERDATLTTLCCGKFAFIDPVGLCVRPDLIVGCNVGLVSNAQDAWCLASITITMKRLHPRLVQGYPGLDLQ